jgi:hypothetical protein
LPLVAALGAIAVICTKHEIVLAIIGGLFVLEAISVMIQVVLVQNAPGKSRVSAWRRFTIISRRMGWQGIDRRDPLLDYCGDSGTGWLEYVETALAMNIKLYTRNLPAPPLRGSQNRSSRFWWGESSRNLIERVCRAVLPPTKTQEGFGSPSRGEQAGFAASYVSASGEHAV